MKEIPLTQGKVALVDDWWYDYLMQWKWFARRHRKTFYAGRNVPYGQGKQTHLCMHRLIVGLDFGDPRQVDHRNRDGLDNREENLRISDKYGNGRNKGVRKDNASGFKGVSLCRNKWRAQICLLGETLHIGLFDVPEQAARAYDRKALELDPEFTFLNFPEDKYAF